MDLKIAWWNCHLSPPSTQAKPKGASTEFLLIIQGLLNLKIDILCLCEVNDNDCEAIKEYLAFASIEKPELSKFSVKSLFSKRGNSIDDFALLYNREKITIEGEAVALNKKTDITEKYLKVGNRLQLTLPGKLTLWLFMCHWQSRGTYHEDAQIRSELAAALRSSVNEILDNSPDALIAVCGDFNDEPFNRSVQMDLKASRDIHYVRRRKKSLFNPFWRLMGVTDLVETPHHPVGTCYTSDSIHLTHWKTFDQIILSSGFLLDDWKFSGEGAEIIHYIRPENPTSTWHEISDHYPILCSLKRVSQ
ncbi:endonuclease/exonuclease/phosphatase family protein [Pseudomonas sp. PSKL.D1]|uniref:endonuclease/exonuclease/phosphatase family protein n=1 Tax=Pseudomonas sp. PSKL.D1 TaxID=3029060 RepID=UPI0023819330|nr:endonuclease/exonuclease/phosphatase family protein [Pseudomonas sp. PSKL.D1]WDY55960.1 hypothetical protein PVV54_15255 [Pseudomonas sp. PSKL.D1]